MAIDIARVGPGIGMKLTQSSLFGKKLSTQPPLLRGLPRRRSASPRRRFEWYDAPKHGSWLDMAKSELAPLFTQRLDRRIPDKPELTAEVAAWVQRRNKHHAKARLAIHNRRRSREAREAISSIRLTWATSGVRRSNRGRSPSPIAPSRDGRLSTPYGGGRLGWGGSPTLQIQVSLLAIIGQRPPSLPHRSLRPGARKRGSDGGGDVASLRFR